MIIKLLVVLSIQVIAISSQRREMRRTKNNDPNLIKTFYILTAVSLLLPTLYILGYPIPRLTVPLSQFMEQFHFNS
ncbi:hypothetical protein [Geomicrobium sp. JCM 19038]|uniref:hypothetical protein n=1 Tax=Geomicrobium sp. JCM 19038 TaxID=1460635 RepID=UPI0005A8B222|nr:hypothetical protein [Geomicrobium sp. JCM 19038]